MLAGMEWRGFLPWNWALGFSALAFVLVPVLWDGQAAASEEAVRVAEVLDGDTLALADGRTLRLAGVQAPKAGAGNGGTAYLAVAEAAKMKLAALTLERDLSLRIGGRRQDRHGRLLGQLFGPDGDWIQGQLVAAGLARVYSYADNRDLVRDLLGLEAAARRGGLGLWALSDFAVRDANRPAGPVNRFALLEGRVVAAAVVRGRGYLNFGSDWDSDFTATVPPKARRLFEAEGIDLTLMEGRVLRVRGWLTEFNGPNIEVTHPEQIELLEER